MKSWTGLSAFHILVPSPESVEAEKGLSHWLISAQLLSESGETVVDTGSLMAPISPSPVHITLLSLSLQ